MRNITLTFIVLTTLFTFCRTDHKNSSSFYRGWRRNVLIQRNGDWELRITYSNKGSRSEGQDGKLLHKRQIIKGSKGDTKITSLGKSLL